MMKIKAIALDDEPPALEIIEAFCNRLDFIDLAGTFTDTTAAFNYLQENHVHLLFLDVNMPELSGMEFYRSLPQKMMVIFTTSFGEYAVESYNLNSIDYLLKPYTFDRFKQAVAKAKERFDLPQAKGSNDVYILLKADYGLVKINLAEIHFVEGLDNYLKLHIENQKPVVTRMTMKALQEKLPEKEFIRVHRSYIISFKHISSVRNKIISIGAEEIPVGRSFEEEFFKLVQQ